MSKYKNMKWILKKQIEKGVKTLWTFDEMKNEFTCIYENYTDGLTIYTPQQLLDKMKEINALKKYILEDEKTQ